MNEHSMGLDKTERNETIRYTKYEDVCASKYVPISPFINVSRSNDFNV